ncbi:MAG: aminotransferase class I/II-fold pyridoxal phosphate-dependent enzyme [Pirellulales bacterium]|nr:aminotransferase class I/II-fold pyridoxal phosphate-dependent enzyme [Pirellulales bacterium]
MVHLDKPPGSLSSRATLVDLVRYRAQRQPQDTAFIYLVDGEDEQVSLSYRELDRQARAIAARLEAQGLTGQRALLLYPAGLEFICAFFGCLYAGVVAVPVYPPRRNRSLDRIQAVADDCEAKVALSTDLVLQRVEPLVDETPHLKQLDWLATCNVPDAAADDWRPPAIDEGTVAFLQYTSGSTGTPKGVMLTHANLLHNSALISHGFEHTRSCMGVYWLPCYHDMGLIGGILQPIYVGRPNVMMAPMSFLQRPLRWLQAITRFGGTTSGGPNFAYDLCVKKIKPDQLAHLDLSTWQVAFNGAEPVRAETLDRFTEKFAPCGFRREAFYPCYGLAEASLIVTGGYAKRPPVVRRFDAASLLAGKAIEVNGQADRARPLVGCGEILDDQQLAIADPDTQTTCAEGQVGEIWVRGPSIARGYWRKPDATKTIFQARLRDSGEGPFLRTGDLGFVDRGELFVTGRIKDLIILHGVNIYPQDVEQTVQHAHKRLNSGDGAAFTIDKDGREQLIVVHEVERRNHGLLDEIFAAIRRAVSAEHELGVEGIALVRAGSIPKTSSGKIQRHACREGYLDGSLQVVASWRLEDGDLANVPLPTAEPYVESSLVELHHSQDTSEPADAAPASNAPASPDAHNSRERKPAGTGVNRPPSKNGRGSSAQSTAQVIEAVLEEVRAVAKQRAAGLTLDSRITELGLDSLERMEILAALEERFGGRFPEAILPDLETARQVVDAVETYLGHEPKSKRFAAVDAEIPEETFRFALFPEYVELRRNLDTAEAMGMDNPFFTAHEGMRGSLTLIGGSEYVNFSSYNYVGMAGDPAVIKAAQDAAAKYGTSVSASRLVSGERDIHVELEHELSRFQDAEATLCFLGGHATNETVIGHLLGPGDLIVHDALAHNSILQGAILSGSRRRSFAHNDVQAADEILKQHRNEYRRALVVIEGVYSMDGDYPDLPQFVELKRRHKAILMVDEAHSMGTLGATGRGIAEHFGTPREDVDIWMGTLSKTFGSCGGYISGCKELIEYLKYTTPGFLYSVGMSPPSAGAALAAVRLLVAEPERVTRLQERSRLFLALAKARGLNTGMSKNSPVVPIILGNSLHCLQLSRALFEQGVNVLPILYPAVEESAARLRFFITSEHTEDQIRFAVDRMAEELERIRPEYAAQELRL